MQPTMIHLHKVNINNIIEHQSSTNKSCNWSPISWVQRNRNGAPWGYKKNLTCWSLFSPRWCQTGKEEGTHINDFRDSETFISCVRRNDYEFTTFAQTNTTDVFFSPYKHQFSQKGVKIYKLMQILILSCPSYPTNSIVSYSQFCAVHICQQTQHKFLE